MPALKQTTRAVVFHNAPPTPPLASHAFRNALGHSTQGLATALRRAEQQNGLDLNEADCTGAFVTKTMLDNTARQARNAMQQAWLQQCTARTSLANTRMDLVKKLREQTSPNTTLLQNLKIELAILPDSPQQQATVTCCEQPPVHDEKIPNKQSKGCDHDEDGGIVIDLDEAAHGAFASSKYLSEVAQGRPEVVMESFKADAAELAEQPIRYLGKELTEGGVADFSTSVGAGAIMLPLAALAVKAGIEEWQHGTHELKELNAVRTDQLKTLNHLQASAKEVPSAQLESRIEAQAVRLEKLEEATQQAHKDRQIGAMSAASGFTIGLKALSDIGLKVSLGVKSAFTGKGFFALSESAQTGTAAAGAAVGFGIAGTFVLGPLAGIFATALGAFFTIKTITKLRQLKTDFEHLKADLKSDALAHGNQTSDASEALRNFLIRQGDKRIGFFKRFARWNKAFMVGSGLYAASAVTKAVVVGVAAAGIVAAASNPIGLAVITAVGIVGAIAMGIASFSFLQGHGKQGKYSRSTATDHAWVDRKLMTDLHAIQTNNARPAFDMAASCLKFLDAQKTALRKFMAEMSTAAGKHSPMEKNLSWWKHLSKQIASEKAVRRFLRTDAGLNHFRTMVKESLQAKNEMLVEKLRHRELTFQLLQADVHRQAVVNNTAELDGSTLPALQQLGETFAKLDSEYGADQAELELNLHRLKQIENDPSMDVQKLASCIDAGDSVKETSQFVHQEMDRDIRHARGVLFESQLEGARVRENQYREMKKT